MFILNGKKIYIDRPIKIGGVSYPNLLDPAVRASLGIVEVPDPVWPTPADEYFVTENEDGTLTATRKPQEMIDKQNAEKARAAADQAATQVAKATPVITYLATHTPAECEAYVQANVTNLESAKSLLGKFAIALCVLSRREFRQDEQ